MSRQSKTKLLTGHQLAEYLLSLPDFPIALASDSEGNSYSPMTSVQDVVNIRFKKTRKYF